MLGAGGPVGHAYHAGVLAALSEVGWDARHADVIVGTSIGALTAGLLRAGLSPDDLLAHAGGRPLSAKGDALLRRGWPDPDFAAALGRRQPPGRPHWGPPASPQLVGTLLRDPRRLRTGLLIAAVAPAGAVSIQPIVAGFDRLLGPLWPAGPLRVVAVDLATGRPTVFGGPAAIEVRPSVALAASCAVPSHFTPVRVGDRRYVDGGVCSPANTEVIGAEVLASPGSLDAVIVSVPMGIGAWPARRGIDLPGRWANHRSARRGLRAVLAARVPTATFEPGRDELSVMGYDAFALAHLAEIAQRAHRATLARLRQDPDLAVVVAAARRHSLQWRSRPEA